MSCQHMLCKEFLITNRAFKIIFSQMYYEMRLQVCFLIERFGTNRTTKWPLSRVDPEVSTQKGWVSEYLVAMVAWVLDLQRM